jgi:hypothetical protein
LPSRANGGKFYERSREKDAAGQPHYEAIVLIGWDAAVPECQCLQTGKPLPFARLTLTRK